MNILFHLLLTLILLSPFTELLRFDMTHEVAIHLPDILAGIIFLYWIIYLLITQKYGKIRKKLVPHPLLLFFLVGLIALLVNSYWLKITQFYIASLYLLRWIVYAGIFFICKHFSKEHKDRIILLLLFDGLIVVLFGYLQYLLYPNLRNLYYLGWDEHLYRLFSVFLDPNFAGIYLVLYLLLVFGVVYKNWQHDTLIKRFVMVCLLLITTGAIILTYSRTAYVMLIVGFILFFIFLKKWRWILFLVVGLILIILFLSPRFYIENTNLFRIKSSEARLATSEIALQIFTRHPLLGVGFDAYRYAQVKYGFRKEQTLYPDHADAGVDNSFLFVLATTGIVGFIIYCYIWFIFLRKRISVYIKTKNVFILVCICSLVASLVSGLFINSLFYAPIMLWLWILLGITE